MWDFVGLVQPGEMLANVSHHHAPGNDYLNYSNFVNKKVLMNCASWDVLSVIFELY